MNCSRCGGASVGGGGLAWDRRPYPLKNLTDAWTLVLGAHFHDTMAGTALPKTYEYSWNNDSAASNQFAAVTQDAAGAVIKEMDTRARGVAVVVLIRCRLSGEDVAEATLPYSGHAAGTVAVMGPDGKEVPAQIVSRDGHSTKNPFSGQAPSVGFAVYDACACGLLGRCQAQLRVDANSLENLRFRVTLNVRRGYRLYL